MPRNQAGEKSKKQLLRSMDTRRRLTKLMHTPSLYTALQRDFSFLSRPNFHCIYSSAAQSGVY